ncbi:hypothetical protein ACIBQ6_12040 [Nonomuraea sp. NPDC049655]|uniref:hypothetical protein n=1 Tax=Nonomuraea sp. NPDC049655 TaxID=3364355 RepID=UPI0037BD8EF8
MTPDPGHIKRHERETMAAEFAIGEYILVQDGRTFEIFHCLTEARRYHVAFLGVDAKPHGDGFKVTIGTRYKDRIVNGVPLKMDQQQFARFQDFMAAAIAARDGTNTP